ncbi:hypothetical protein E2C01_020832 [Portunus trituberculatus]|uniref:Uncharacterized protein n=1 Tax=Portunus trituberculatus TaxID=210409 RepID=A0A5B7E2L8_PORTR|nr:hypothetical protein [Portunus trituberculatus]
MRCCKPSIKATVFMILLNVSLCVSQLKGAVTACPLKTTLLHIKLHTFHLKLKI